MPSQTQSTARSTTRTQIVPGMKKVYNQLLKLNTQNYNKMVSAYNQGSQQIANTLPGIYAGYGDLEERIMSTLGMGAPLGGDNWGVAQPAANQIRRDFARTQGQQQQQMINAGLGNTTVLANFDNQNTRAAGEAYGALGANLANLAAGYQRDVGLAGQAAQMQGLGLQANYTLGGVNALGNYRFANTAGDLTGQFGTCYSTSSGTNSEGGAAGVTGGVNFGGMSDPNGIITRFNQRYGGAGNMATGLDPYTASKMYYQAQSNFGGGAGISILGEAPNLYGQYQLPAWGNNPGLAVEG